MNDAVIMMARVGAVHGLERTTLQEVVELHPGPGPILKPGDGAGEGRAVIVHGEPQAIRARSRIVVLIALMHQIEGLPRCVVASATSGDSGAVTHKAFQASGRRIHVPLWLGLTPHRANSVS